MKILLIARNSSDTFGFHLLENLHSRSDAFVCHYDYYLFKHRKLRFLVRVLPNLFLPIHRFFLALKGVSDFNTVICTYKNVDARLFWYLKKKGLYLVSINPDHLGTLGNQELIRASFDAYWVKCRIMHRQFSNKTSLRSLVYDEAYSNNYNYIEDKGYRYDILLVGSMYPYRLRFIHRFLDELSKLAKTDLKILIASNVPCDNGFTERSRLKVYNTGFKFLNEKRRVFSECKFAINLMHINEIDSTNAKFIEFFSMGIPQMVDSNDLLYETLSPKFNQKFTFINVEDCVRKILKNLEEYEPILELYLKERESIIKGRSYEDLIDRIISDIKENSELI